MLWRLKKGSNVQPVINRKPDAVRHVFNSCDHGFSSTQIFKIIIIKVELEKIKFLIRNHDR